MQKLNLQSLYNIARSALDSDNPRIIQIVLKSKNVTEAIKNSKNEKINNKQQISEMIALARIKQYFPEDFENYEAVIKIKEMKKERLEENALSALKIPYLVTTSLIAPNPTNAKTVVRNKELNHKYERLVQDLTLFKIYFPNEYCSFQEVKEAYQTLLVKEPKMAKHIFESFNEKSKEILLKKVKII